MLDHDIEYDRECRSWLVGRLGKMLTNSRHNDSHVVGITLVRLMQLKIRYPFLTKIVPPILINIADTNRNKWTIIHTFIIMKIINSINKRLIANNVLTTSIFDY